MVYEGLESREQRVVALGVESIDEILLGALSPVSDRAGEAADAAAGLGGDATEHGRLRRGEVEVGEIGLPRPPPCPVCHAEKEPDTVGGHLALVRWRTRSPYSAR